MGLRLYMINDSGLSTLNTLGSERFLSSQPDARLVNSTPAGATDLEAEARQRRARKSGWKAPSSSSRRKALPASRHRLRRGQPGVP